MENNEYLEPIATEESTAAESISAPVGEPLEDPEQTIVYMGEPEQYYDVIYNAVNDALIAQTVTDGQNINNTALEYFKGIMLNQSPFTDYVVYVGAPYTYWQNNMERTAYEYVLAYGDLELSGTTFSGQADLVTMRVQGENSIAFTNDQYISVNAPMYYSRSNLGSYSGIVQKDFSGFAILMTLLLGGAVWLVKSFLTTK